MVRRYPVKFPLYRFRLYYLRWAGKFDHLVGERTVVGVLRFALPLYCLVVTAIATLENHMRFGSWATVHFHDSYCRSDREL